MERGNRETGRVHAILTSDWHLREDTPVCRTDSDFVQTMIGKMDFVSSLQRQYKCPVFHAGDLFHYWKSSPYLISIALQHLPEDFWSIPGQHDLPQHNKDLVFKSAYGTILTADRIKTSTGWAGWGVEPGEELLWHGCGAMLMHRLVWKNKPPFPGCTDKSAREVLEAYPDYDLIVTGDNHVPFVEKLDGRLLVNPGSLMRQTADQIDHKPRVYLWNGETNSVTPVYIPVQPVVTREHLEEKEERDTRIQAFVERLSHEEWNEELSFEENLERFMKENHISESVRGIVYKAIDKGEPNGEE